MPRAVHWLGAWGLGDGFLASLTSARLVSAIASCLVKASRCSERTGGWRWKPPDGCGHDAVCYPRIVYIQRQGSYRSARSQPGAATALTAPEGCSLQAAVLAFGRLSFAKTWGMGVVEQGSRRCWLSRRLLPAIPRSVSSVLYKQQAAFCAALDEAARLMCRVQAGHSRDWSPSGFR
jgi:hypothetical protein